eukprot:TRINITY_DN12081_c0_g1_i1.p1 TRINITY_DN12081_c0_g1~~TRINITY_DN12081_c0_g1_i1.p1  ORF type:complete len:222 (-),score=43.28 TRINITY_DN12081_c0_g1_i1:21-686(-)
MLVFLAFFLTAVFAQDPPPGWLGYATATCPPNTKLTHMEAKWKVGANPQPSGAFFSPWFGADTTDNMNLIQPVNPWFGDSWSLYTEYYQWSDGYNRNSDSVAVNAGDTLWGQLTYLGDDKQSYKLSNTDLTTSKSSGMTIPVQKDSNGHFKKYTILYIVYEKVAECSEYPPDGSVTFTDIKVFCNNTLITPEWKTAYVEDVCNNRAHVVNPQTVKITWDTK